MKTVGAGGSIILDGLDLAEGRFTRCFCVFSSIKFEVGGCGSYCVEGGDGVGTGWRMREKICTGRDRGRDVN